MNQATIRITTWTSYQTSRQLKHITTSKQHTTPTTQHMKQSNTNTTLHNPPQPETTQEPMPYNIMAMLAQNKNDTKYSEWSQRHKGGAHKSYEPKDYATSELFRQYLIYQTIFYFIISDNMQIFGKSKCGRKINYHWVKALNPYFPFNTFNHKVIFTFPIFCNSNIISYSTKQYSGSSGKVLYLIQ